MIVLDTKVKWLGAGRRAFHGGVGRWPEVGIWTHPEPPILCESGWHYCTVAQSLKWLATECYLIEVDGTIIDEDDKSVCARARLIRKLNWDPVKFAKDCANRVAYLVNSHSSPRAAVYAADAAVYAATAAVYAATAATAAVYAATAAADAVYAATAAVYAATAAARSERAAQVQLILDQLNSGEL